MKNLAKLNGAKALSKNEQKSINGGGTRGCSFCLVDDHCGGCDMTAYMSADWYCGSDNRCHS